MPRNVSVRGAFQLTPSARRATRVVCVVRDLDLISIHALRGESDSATIMLQKLLKLFQSTLSARRATGGSGTGHSQGDDFNPRSPWGERRFWVMMR